MHRWTIAGTFLLALGCNGLGAPSAPTVTLTPETAAAPAAAPVTGATPASPAFTTFQDPRLAAPAAPLPTPVPVAAPVVVPVAPPQPGSSVPTPIEDRRPVRVVDGEDPGACHH